MQNKLGMNDVHSTGLFVNPVFHNYPLTEKFYFLSSGFKPHNLHYVVRVLLKILFENWRRFYVDAKKNRGGAAFIKRFVQLGCHERAAGSGR